MGEISWPVVFGLGATGIGMGLVSCLVGLRPRVENPLWWLIYAGWVVVVVATGNTTPFRTILFASVIAGALHGVTSSLLLDKYIQNNPWHAERIKDTPKPKLSAMFITTGLIIGGVFGALVGGIAFWIAR